MREEKKTHIADIIPLIFIGCDFDLICSQIPSYDHTKHTVLNTGWMKEGPALHIVSSMVAGFMAALTTSPVDVVKTRIMNQKYERKQLTRFD